LHLQHFGNTLRQTYPALPFIQNYNWQAKKGASQIVAALSVFGAHQQRPSLGCVSPSTEIRSYNLK